MLCNQRVVLSVNVNYSSSCWGFYKKVGQQEVSLYYSLWLCACVPKLTVKRHPLTFFTVFFNMKNKLLRLLKRMKYAIICICKRRKIQVCRKQLPIEVRKTVPSVFMISDVPFQLNLIKLIKTIKMKLS